MRKFLKILGIVFAVVLFLAGAYFAVLSFGLDTKFNERVLKPLKAKMANCKCACPFAKKA